MKTARAMKMTKRKTGTAMRMRTERTKVSGSPQQLREIWCLGLLVATDAFPFVIVELRKDLPDRGIHPILEQLGGLLPENDLGGLSLPAGARIEIDPQVDIASGITPGTQDFQHTTRVSHPRTCVVSAAARPAISAPAGPPGPSDYRLRRRRVW